MIDLPQVAPQAHRIRIQPRRNPRPCVTHRIQPSVDRGHAGRRDRNQPRLVLDSLLKVRKQECAVTHNGPAQTGSILRLRQRQRCAGKRVGRIQMTVPEVSEQIAVPFVGAALRQHVHEAAGGAPEFGLPSAGHHLKLTHAIQAQIAAGQSGRIIIRRKSVHHEVVREVPLAADRNPLPRHRRRLGERLIAARVGRRHAGNQQRQVQIAASV